jgi:hypothetical protein
LFFLFRRGRLLGFGLRFLFWLLRRLRFFFFFRGRLLDFFLLVPRWLLFLFRFRFGNRLFSFRGDERDFVANVYLAAFFDVNLGKLAVVSGFPFHGGFVRLDLSQDFARGNIFSFLLFPAHQRPFGHGVAEFRHFDFWHDLRELKK